MLLLAPAQGITAQNIRLAYVYGSRDSQRRIEEYGKLNREILSNLLRDEKKKE